MYVLHYAPDNASLIVLTSSHHCCFGRRREESSGARKIERCAELQFACGKQNDKCQDGTLD